MKFNILTGVAALARTFESCLDLGSRLEERVLLTSEFCKLCRV